ncbi:MAG: DsbA family protein [Acidobacteriia bacterium]|nr:DsbA family protein [Terriglobia bacterium]
MKKIFGYANWAVLPLLVLLPFGSPIHAKDKDEGITKQQADEILNELRQIRQLLEKQAVAAPQPGGEQITKAKLGLEGAYTIGSKDAPLTMVEFTDFQCPFCQRFHVSTFADLKRDYIDTGKLRFVSRDLPLDFHPNAMQAAEAGRCAGEQGQFWAMRDRMNANPDKLDMNSLASWATELKLNVPNFRSCVENQKYKNAIQTDILAAQRVGANGTPSFVVGKSTPDGVDGELIVGAQPYQVFDQKLKEFAR